MDTKQVKQIAQLARIAVDEDQLPEIGQALTSILEFAGHISDANVSGVEPMAHPLEINQPLRADEAVSTDQRAVFQALAPASERGLFLVPKVIE